MRYLTLLLLFFTAGLCAQSERFDDFRATITLDTAGDVTVTERIAVTAAGKQIKRGITRPLRRRRVGSDLEKELVDYEVQSASQDGQTANFHTKTKGGYRTVYLGDKNVVLPAGQYNYELTYTSTDRIYFPEVADEFRWSAFSTDLRIPVEKAEITLILPPGQQATATSCYVGGNNSPDASRCRVSTQGNQLIYTVIGGLAPGEGLDFSATFPKGSFHQPPPPPPPSPLQQKGTYYLSLIGIFTALFYALTSWQKYGVDPEAPDIKHQYYPPKGISPASLAYRNSGWASQHQLTASLTALSINGYLDIVEETRSGLLSTTDVFILRPRQKKITPELPAEQAVLYDRLFEAGEITLDGKYNEKLQKATTFHNESLRRQHQDFLKQGSNAKKIIPYVLLLLVPIIIAAFFLKYAGTFGIVTFCIAVFLLLAGTGLFAWLIQKPSPEKVAFWAEVKGLKNYLKLKEADRKALYNVPEMTQEYFQQVLPYAIALGIENDWAEDLAADLAGSMSENSNRNTHVAPFLIAGFGGRMGTAYSAVATPAGAGGGVGGGGMSGGGGGSGGW